jgi:hypothetical protein
MLVANSAVLAWFVNIFSSGFQIGIWFYILIFIVLIAYLLIFKVLAPRISVLRGTDPKSILKAEDDLAGFIEDEENTESQKIKVFYYHQICRYQKRMTKYSENLSERVFYYKGAMAFSFLLFIYVVFATILLSL